jgi:hypothetical protein
LDDKFLIDNSSSDIIFELKICGTLHLSYKFIFENFHPGIPCYRNFVEVHSPIQSAAAVGPASGFTCISCTLTKFIIMIIIKAG